MSGWKVKQLGDVAYLAGRIGWKGLTAKEYTTEGPLFVSVHSLNYGDFVDFRDAFHISQERYDESPEIMLRVNDILICKDGAGIGKLGIVGDLPGPATINSSLLLIRALDGADPKFLYRALCSPSFQKIVQERIDGATTPHLYQREIRQFPILLPPLAEQRRVVAILDQAFEALEAIRSNAEKKLSAIGELKQALLHKAFSGGLTKEVASVATAATEVRELDPKHATAMIIALAYERHKGAKRERSYGHTKAQKILHLVESEGDLNLARGPYRDAAGPNDFAHMLAAEEWAESRQYFRFPQVGQGHQFQPMAQFDTLKTEARQLDPATRARIESIIDLFVPMDMQAAELFATVYAAWNNLLLEGKTPSDDEIIRAAREDWHPEKLKIPRHKFADALKAVKQSAFRPTGKGKAVVAPVQGTLFG